MNPGTFLRDREIERYRRLACAALTGPERTRMLDLMANEEDKITEFDGREAMTPAQPLADQLGATLPA